MIKICFFNVFFLVEDFFLIVYQLFFFFNALKYFIFLMCVLKSSNIYTLCLQEKNYFFNVK
jgi:hypothetical protein